MAGNFRTFSQPDELQGNRLAALKQAGQRWHQGDDLMVRLCRRLTTTLALEELIAVFADELGCLVPFDQFTYRHRIGHRDFVYASGLGGPHRCDYQLSLEGVSYGSLVLTRRQRFGEDELAAVEQLLGVLICPLRNACQFARVEQAALTDSLTAIPNKRALDMALQRECGVGDRHGDISSLILVDLDHFKTVNDTYGHVVGDHLLRATAGELDRATRAGDGIFRFGGEEFAILLPHTGEAEAIEVADRIRRFIDDIAVECGGHPVAVTASAGVATRREGEKPEQWLTRADNALYQAKEQGRNCTRVARQVTAPRPVNA